MEPAPPEARRELAIEPIHPICSSWHTSGGAPTFRSHIIVRYVAGEASEARGARMVATGHTVSLSVL